MADKKPEKKEEAPNPNAEIIKALWWVGGVIVVLSFLLTNWNGVFFDITNDPIEDPETGRVVGTDRSVKFPVGTIDIDDEVILKSESFIRSAPGHSLLGKQKKYETAFVEEGPLEAFGQSWWRLNFENAPDGWVAEYAMTEYVTTYKVVHFIPITWIKLKPVLWVLGIVFFILYMAASLRLKALRSEAEEKLTPTKKADIVVTDVETKEILTAGDRRSNDRWMHIVQLLQSHNQNDWRQAIIEADIILEEMLDKMGYDGVSIGDKLKNVEPSDFRTINQAWEAHKVRNRIAHMGSEFQISHAETERVINLYQEVFDEFYYI